MLNIKNLGVRIATGIVFIAVLMGGILYNQYSFLIVFSLITALALYEFYGLLCKTQNAELSRILNTLGGLFLFIGGYFFFSSTEKSLITLVPYGIYVLSLFISELYLKRTNPIQSLAYAVLGQIYLAIPLSLLSYLAFGYDMDNGGYHYAFLLALLVFIWVNDSFAYLTGSLFGKHHMFERISPKKSWEGFFGGAIFSIGASVIFANYFTQLPLWGWIGFALVMITFGTLGDLIESLFKRTLNVKDSGNILPGHGGILDRFDSVIFSIPALFIYIEIVSFFIYK
ncbi:phosphatidate cytidylyltransferase [Dysgonomonas sp. HGC4]|uniref:phosphatidate cytidylyltransferase n=1 Tax=Dysgonomonas sp. HGC4 TaxID=1658009 RepID=UPI000AE51843|nr:phosphatidate cytidylyltransferase [Dysgonomonas sp. HGC4]